MNAIALALLMAVQAAPPVPRQIPADSSGQHQKGEQQGKTEKPSANGLPVQKAPHASPANDPHEDRAADNEERRVIVDRLPNKDPWDKVYIVLTGILVVVGIFTLIAICYQAIQTKDAAMAAAESARAIVNAERPWVIGEIEDLSIKDAMLAKAAGSSDVPVFCILKNYGAKPVWIVSGGFDLRLVESIDNLPAEPNYEPQGPFSGQTPLLPEGSGQCLRIPRALSLEGFQAAISGSKLLFAYGFIRYTDVFGIERESRFSFVYAGNPRKFRHGGPASYNKYT